MSSAMLVPRCNAVTNGRKQLLPAHAVSVAISAQPSSPVRITVWPRLLMGNNSVTPCSNARTIACQIFRFILHPLLAVGIFSSIINSILLLQLFEFLIGFGED